MKIVFQKNEQVGLTGAEEQQRFQRQKQDEMKVQKHAYFL